MVIFITALLAFAADRASKLLILKYAFGLSFPVTDKFGESLPLLKGVFNLTYYGNTGMAFGMFAGNKALLISLCIIILAVMLFAVRKLRIKSRLALSSIGMITGGALGNLLDRILYGFVIDYFDFCLIDYPIFNVADCFVVAGAVLLCVYVIFFDKKEDKVG